MADTNSALSYSGCRICLHKPCERLRFGRVFPGKFLFIHKRYCGAGYKECPFVPLSFEEIRFSAGNAPLADIIDITEDVLTLLSVEEQMLFRQDHFVYRYGDTDGRLRFLNALWDNGVIGAVRVPWDFFSDTKLAKWLLANETLVYTMKQDLKAQDDKKAVTDSLDEQQAQSVTLSNPRWEHADAKRKEKNPDKAAVGDAVVLMADVSGLAEGAAVSFIIYDASASPSMRFETASGKNENGVAKAQWEVKDPRGNDESGEIKFEFDASAKSKTTEKTEIPVTACSFCIRLNIDPNDKESQDDTFTMFSTDEAKTYRQELTIKDDKIPGDSYTDLKFTGMDNSLSYSLEIDLGKEGDKYLIIENKPFGELHG